MKKVAYIREYTTESFGVTLQKALQQLEREGGVIFHVQILPQSAGYNGDDDAAYIIYDQTP